MRGFLTVFIVLWSSLLLLPEEAAATGSSLENCINDTMLETGKSRDEILPICLEIYKNSSSLTEEEYQRKLEERREIIRLGRELNRPISEVQQELKQRGLDNLKPPASRQRTPRAATVPPVERKQSSRCKALDTREFGLVPTGSVNDLWSEADLVGRYGPPCRVQDNGRNYRLLWYDGDGYNNGSLFKVVNDRVVSKTRMR